MKNKALFIIPIMMVCVLSSCFFGDTRYIENMQKARIELVLPYYRHLQEGYNTNIVIYSDDGNQVCRDIDSKYLSALAKATYKEVSKQQVEGEKTKVYYGFGEDYRNIYLTESLEYIIINYTVDGPLPPKPAIRYYKIDYESGLEMYNTALGIVSDYQALLNNGGIEDFTKYFKSFSPLVTTKTSYQVVDKEYKVLDAIKGVNEYTLLQQEKDFSKNTPLVKYEMAKSLDYQGFSWTLYLYSYIYVKLDFKYRVNRETISRTYLYEINFNDGYRINEVATNIEYIE